LNELEKTLFNVIDLLKEQLGEIERVKSIDDSIEAIGKVIDDGYGYCAVCEVGGAKYSFKGSDLFYCEDCFAQKENELNNESKVIAGKPGKPRVSQYDCMDCKESNTGGRTYYLVRYGVYLCENCVNRRDKQ